MGCSSSGISKGPQFRNAYNIKHKLGEGAFGVVHEVEQKATGRILAVKMIDKSTSKPHEVQAEIEIMKRLDHHNVNKIIEVFSDQCFMYIITEEFLGGDVLDGLQRHLKRHGRIPDPVLVRCARQFADATAYIHSIGVVHRDIKGDNFLMDRPDIQDVNVRLVMTDFGTSTSFKPDSGKFLSEQIGTEMYWSPEVIRKKYTNSCDLWALGVCMYGLVDGTFPYKTCDQILHMPLRKPKVVSDPGWALLQAMLEKDPNRRISGQQMQEHEYVIASPATSPEPVDDPVAPSATSTLKPAAVMQLREDIDEAVAHRRQHLLKALDQDHIRGEEIGSNSRNSVIGGSVDSSSFNVSFKAEDMTVEGPKPGEKHCYEWWTPEKCKEKQIENGVPRHECFIVPTEAPSGEQVVLFTPETLTVILENFNIDISLFGKDKARTLQDFSKECLRGEATLSTFQGKLLRVVDVIILRVRDKPGGKLLVEKSQKFLDDRVRIWNRLPGMKRRPHESPKMTGVRVLETMLQINSSEVDWTGAMEMMEDRDTSPSYPGVETLYRKQIAECVLRSDVTPTRLAQLGLPKFDEFETFLTGEGTSTWMWQGEKQCKKLGIKLFGSTSAANFVAPAPAPLMTNQHGGEEGIRERFERCGIDTSKFGAGQARSLEDIADELKKGECSLQQGSSGPDSLLRVVSVVAIRLVHGESEQMLIETREELPDGRSQSIPRLPGLKQRTHENAFHVARRFITTTLGIPDILVHLSDIPEQLDEEKESPSYPGLKTLYRKQVIDAVVGDKARTNSKKLIKMLSNDGGPRTAGMANLPDDRVSTGRGNQDTIQTVPREVWGAPAPKPSLSASC